MASEVVSELVANVWKVVVSPGDEVADGDTICILEPMRMEIPVLHRVRWNRRRAARLRG